jgi:hypothetical protein
VDIWDCTTIILEREIISYVIQNFLLQIGDRLYVLSIFCVIMGSGNGILLEFMVLRMGLRNYLLIKYRRQDFVVKNFCGYGEMDMV